MNQAVLERFIYLLEMEDMQQINWSCIEITKTKKRFIETVRSFRDQRKLGLKTDTQFIYTVREALNRTVKGTQLFPLNNVGDIVGLDGHEGKNWIVGYTIQIILYEI